MAKTLIANTRLLSFLIIALSILLMGVTIENGTAHDPTEPPPAFMPAKTEELNYRSLNLTATFLKPGNQWAIINGQTYHEGDAIGEYIITNIEIDTVELIDSANNKEVLQLVTPIKKAASIKEE